jgi:hypothetical protein
MAQTNQQVLEQILGVCKQINKKVGGKDVTGDGTAGSGGKSDKGTGPLSGMFGKGKDTKKAKEAAAIVKDVLKSITDFNKVKINTRKINATSKALRGLFNTVIYIGNSRKVVKNAIKMFDLLARSLRTMTKFAKAMSTLLMTIGLSIVAIAGSIALAGVLLGTRGKPVQTMLAIVGVLVGLTGAMVLMGKFKSPIERGAKTAKKMGTALMFLAGGLFLFSLTVANIGKILGAPGGIKGMIMGIMGAIGIIGVMGLVFVVLGKFAKKIVVGALVAVAMGLGLASLAWGLDKFASTAQKITAMGDGGTATKKRGKRKGEEKGQFGQMMANIGPGLGVMGILLVSSALLFAALGIPVVAGLIGLGAGVAIAIGVALNTFSKGALHLVMRAKTLENTNVQDVVSNMVGGVIGGVVSGLSIGLMGREVTNVKDLKLRGFGKLKRGIRMLRNVAKMLSLFAKSLTAFANLGNMREIVSYDEKTGKPKFGPTIDIQGVGNTIRDTLVSFLIGDGSGSKESGGLLGATDGLRRRQGGAIDRMARALTGKRGMLTAIIQFADVLKTFAQFGPKGEIGYVEMVPDGTDKDGNAQWKQVPHSIKILDVTKVITDSIGQFSTGIAEGVEGISRRDARKILNMSKALIGVKRRDKAWRADKPGLLEPINAFSETLTLYAKFGEKGEVPGGFNEDGTPKDPVSVEKIVKNIVKAISEFSTQLSTQLAEPGQSVKDAQKRMEGYMGLVSQLSELSTAADGLDRTAESIMSLATSMGALAENVNKFELDKLQVFADIAKENKGVGGMMQNIQARGDERRESRQERRAESSSTTTATNTTIATTPSGESIDIDALANAIGVSVSSAFKSGQFTFEFATDKSGVLTFP